MRARACNYLLTELDVVHKLLATLLALRFDQDQGLVSLLQDKAQEVVTEPCRDCHTAQLLYYTDAWKGCCANTGDAEKPTAMHNRLDTTTATQS